MTLKERIQSKTTEYTIIGHEYIKGEGHVWTVKNNSTGEVSKKNTYELTGGTDTAANNYKNKTNRKLKDGAKNVKHGMSNTKFYREWKQMKNRCNNPSQPHYPEYKDKGYAPEWETFEGFYNDMYDTYVEGLTIDRIDGNLGYFPENCRWADYKTQLRNTRANVKVTLCEGLDYKCNLIDLSDAFGMNSNTARSRYHSGWELGRALTKPTRQNPFDYSSLSEEEQRNFIKMSNDILGPIIEEAVNALCEAEDEDVVWFRERGATIEINRQ